MKAFFFEQFGWMLAVAVVLWVICMTNFYQRRTKLWKRATALSPVLFAALLAVNALVVTDREAIRRQLDRLVRACRDADIPALRELMDDHFDSDGAGKEEVLRAAEGTLRNIKIERVRFLRLTIHPPRLEAKSVSYMVIRPSGQPIGRIESSWELAFVRRNNVWLLSTVTPLTVNNQPVHRLMEVIRMSHTF